MAHDLDIGSVVTITVFITITLTILYLPSKTTVDHEKLLKNTVTLLYCESDGLLLPFDHFRTH